MDAFAAEWRKLITTRTTWVLIVIGLLYGFLTLGFLLFGPAGVQDTFGRASAVDLAASSVGGNSVWLLVIGLLAVTTEFRHGTAGRTFLIEPNRLQVVGAKAVAVAAAAAAFTLVAVAGSLVLVAIDDRGLSLPGAAWREVGQAGTGIVLTSVLGVAIGALLRRQVLAIVLTLVEMFAAEPALTLAVPEVGRWLPFQVLRSVFVPDDGAAAGSLPFEPLDPGVALLVFAAYVVAFAVGGAMLMARRDV